MPRLQHPAAWPLIVAVCVAVATLATLDAGGDYPWLGEGPGPTIDESFNVQQGVLLTAAAKEWLLGGITWREVFGDPAGPRRHPLAGLHNPDHPPLGRFWLGLCHQAFVSVAPPREHSPDHPFVTTAARSGSALAFAATVFLVGWCAARWHGPTAGAIAAVSLALMPRVVAHAHIASLETCIGLAYAGCVLYVADRWDADAPPTMRRALIGGLLFGLALLTKIQAVFLPAAVGLWALARWRHKAIMPCLIWGATGLAVLFLAWPWLWLHPWDHLMQYLGRTTNRVALHTWYFGERYADRDVPWHFPWVMFAVTVPIGLHILGLVGLRSSLGAGRKPGGRVEFDAGGERPQHGTTASAHAQRHLAWVETHATKEWLLFAAIVVPLLAFSLPGVAVYDGERLFLVAFPLWALFIGRGGSVAADWLLQRLAGVKEPRRRRAMALIAGTFLALQAVGLATTYPCGLCYDNLAAGGLPGAERMGLELCYWGDAVTRSLLRETAAAVPRGATVHVAPVLHQFQLGELATQSPAIRRKGVVFVPYEGERSPECEWLLVFRRRADMPEPWPAAVAEVTPIAEVRRQGVPLAGLYRLKPRGAFP